MTVSLDRIRAALSERYVVQRELGAGGMATVYLAEDTKLHRQVAIKVLRPALAAVLGAERFLKEIDVTANLQHPNILPLHDSGEAEGFLYYVMPFVDGETLRDKLHREGQLPVDEALRIADAMARALDHAHERGIVHRDVKPGNVLLAGQEAMLADFGIARAITQVSDDRLTETGVSVGTPSYMSPEQASGEGAVDHRTDVYALACVLYEMIGGRPPFRGSTDEVLRQHLVADPPPISVFRTGVTPSLVAAIRKSLSKDPADRHPSGESLVADACAPQSSRRRHQRAMLAAGLVVPIGLALSVWLVKSAPPAPAIPRVAVTAFENAAGDESLSHVGEAVRRSILEGVAQLTVVRASSADEADDNASMVVGGFFVPRGDSLEFVLEIRDREADRMLPPPERVRAPRNDPLASLETISNRVMAALSHYRHTFDAHIAAGRRPVSSYEAYLAFDAGLNFAFRGQWRQAEEAFRRAIRLEPTYTEAYLWLGSGAL